MRSLIEIQVMNEREVAKGCDEGGWPFPVCIQDVDRWRAFIDAGHNPQLPFPHLFGERGEPAGWHPVALHMLPSACRFGDTVPELRKLLEFVNALIPSHGYAFTDTDAGYMVVTEYVRVQ